MPGLNSREQRILARIEFCPETPAHVIAKATRLKTPTVSYTMRRLHERGIIRQRGFVNPCRLGFTDVAMYFSLIDQAQKQREKLIRKIIAHDHVLYLGSVLGDYHYVLNFMCRSLSEIPQFMRETFGGQGDLFSDKLIAPRVSLTQFARKYLDAAAPVAEPLVLSGCGAPAEIDEIDHRLLTEVANRGFDSFRQLAAAVGVPFSTVERRLQALRAKGVLPGYYYEIDTDAIGIHTFRLLVMKKGICSSTRARLHEFCAKHPLVTYLIESIGAWDFEIIIETFDPRNVTSLVEELYGTCGMRIASVRTLSEVRSHKCTLYPFSSRPPA